MTWCRGCLSDAMRNATVVEVVNPTRSDARPFYGRIVGLQDLPSMVLEQLDGRLIPLPQLFRVTEVDDWNPVDAARARVARCERELAEARDLLARAEAEA